MVRINNTKYGQKQIHIDWHINCVESFWTVHVQGTFLATLVLGSGFEHNLRKYYKNNKSIAPEILIINFEQQKIKLVSK